MKILLFGKKGQVGWELNRSLLPLGDVVALCKDEADFSEPEKLRKIVSSLAPDIIVNAAAYTAVDNAEENEGVAFRVNAASPGVLAEEALKLNALLIHYSTDYVFDGTKKTLYTESDAADPVNAYGRTKLAGEKAIQASGCAYLIFRTSWVYAGRGNNFLLTILKSIKEKKELDIVSDQIGAPTSARLIADTTSQCLMLAIQEMLTGHFISELYHLSASGTTSWHGFSEEIVRVARLHNYPLKIERVNRVLSSDYPVSANRPLSSLLSTKKLQNKFKVTLPDWKISLDMCLQEIGYFGPE
ncbi:MAG TPA: dTDP-4-dehydrorhamnose reductase [Gammaproteobacteria bacterium]|nr:dTDP-4-dehydrorhamnose reductase [Gammaproteobacteria bacterium]